MPTSLFGPDFQAVLNRAVNPPSPAAAASASPEDWRDRWIYFLMLDRFNNPSGPPVHQPFDDPGYSGFQGGTFSGVQQQLSYIKGLGAGAIWLSPVLKNFQFDRNTYHGYGIHNFIGAEPRFADNPAAADDELRTLVDAAHQQDLFVIFDIVLNHTGNAFAYQCDPADQFCLNNQGAQASFHPSPQPVQWRDATGAARPDFPDVAAIPNPSLDAVVWPLELQRNNFFRRQGTPDPSGDDTVGDFSILKQMMTADPDLQRFLIRSFQYVIARFDIDGFRIDTIRYLKGDLPRLFGNSMREFALSIGKKNFFTFGEVFDSNAEQDIARFIGRNTGDQSELVGVDAALDYPLFNTLKPVVKGFAPPAAVVGMYQNRKNVEANVLSSHGDATRYFVTFLDNHDVKERIRYVDPVDPTKFDDQVTLGLACLYSLPGIPCLYYGTEQGLHGSGSDPAVREALWGGPGFDEQSDFYQDIRQIASVRAQQSALRYGRFYFRPISGDGVNFGVSGFPQGVVAFSRILNDQEVVVAANTNAAQAQQVDVIVEILLSSAGDRFDVLYSNQTAPEAPQPVRPVPAGTPTVHEVDGSIGTGPLHVIRINLRPLEAQILRAHAPVPH
ncbi:MAG TPA: alpha-amylase family glycosyl hydrolase [Candidatus Sulfotelmatobacter sp.]|nr:alpha-amylase family glycosyl hydrolase [Candidatus Sulfotelmatobacter sp.]